MEISRKILVVLAWLFVVGVLVQFFLAGLGMFGSEPDIGPHEAFGYMGLHFFPVFLLIAAAIGRVGKRLIILIAVLFAVTFVQPLWAALFQGEILGALHVVGGAAIRALGHAVAERATKLVRSPFATV